MTPAEQIEQHQDDWASYRRTAQRAERFVRCYGACMSRAEVHWLKWRSLEPGWTQAFAEFIHWSRRASEYLAAHSQLLRAELAPSHPRP